MKTGIIMWSLGAILGGGAAYAYAEVTTPTAVTYIFEPGQYCAQMRDGKMIVLFEGKEISGDVFLKNGTTVKPDGTIISKDGVRMNLKEGQCIDQFGSITGETMKQPYDN